jgi:hypothetical protein
VSVTAEGTSVVEPPTAGDESLTDMGVIGAHATGLSRGEGVSRLSDLLRGLRLCCSKTSSVDAQAGERAARGVTTSGVVLGLAVAGDRCSEQGAVCVVVSLVATNGCSSHESGWHSLAVVGSGTVLNSSVPRKSATAVAVAVSGPSSSRHPAITEEAGAGV